MRNKNHIEEGKDTRFQRGQRSEAKESQIRRKIGISSVHLRIIEKDFCSKPLGYSSFIDDEGKTDPGYETLKRIAEAFPRDFDQLDDNGKGPIRASTRSRSMGLTNRSHSRSGPAERRSLGAMEGSTQKFRKLFGNYSSYNT